MKQYLVIGGSSGIGRAVSRQLAESGAHVHATYHTHHQPAEKGIEYFPLDVMTAQHDLSLLPEIIDGLVYCPGSILLKPFARLTADDFLQDYQIQVLGAVRIIQQVLPRLKKADHPAVILFSTVAVQTGFNFHSLVASSKGAIEGLTRALAAELAPAIRVNCIAPSITDTPLAAQLLSTPEKKEANALRHPLKKIGVPEDIAASVCFLLSKEAGWITGQVLKVDGGMSSVKL